MRMPLTHETTVSQDRLLDLPEPGDQRWKLCRRVEMQVEFDKCTACGGPIINCQVCGTGIRNWYRGVCLSCNTNHNKLLDSRHQSFRGR